MDLQDAKSQYSEDLMKIITFSERVPMASKLANNRRWFKLRTDAVDIQYPSHDQEYIERVEDNYRLMDGLPMLNYTKGAYRASKADLMALQSEGIDIPNTEIEHFDFVSPYLDGLWGDQKRRKLKFTVSDSSKFTQNYIKEHGSQQLKAHFETKLINPAKKFAALQWQINNGVEDIFALSPEERQQMQSDINKSMESLIPKDIANFMTHGAMGNIEKQGQAIAEALVAHLDLKYELDEAYRHSFATDGIVFHSGVRRNKVFTEWVDLTQFNTGGSTNTFIDKNPWFKWWTMRHPKDIWTRYSEDWNREDIKRFESMISVRAHGSETAKDEKFVTAIDFQGQELMSKTNMLTQEGQRQWGAILDKYRGADVKNYEDVRDVLCVWSSLCKMKEITRGYNDGSIRVEYFNEDYVFNPQHGDLKEKVIWVPQYCQGRKIGEGDEPIFTELKPVPYQKRDISDPYECSSPFTGGYLHDRNGKGYRRSPLDKVKPLIHAVNFQMKTIRDREATDIGKVVLMTVAAKPKGWSWGKLIEVVRATKMLPINTQASGLTAADVQFFREIDLSNMYDILPRINYLMFLIQRIGEGLSSNAARQGAQAASTSVSNNMSNLNRSFSQTHGRASWIDKIAEHLIENLIYYGKMSIKSGNIFMRYALDDLSIANIDIDVDELDEAYFGVRVTTDEVDMEKLDVSRNLLLPFIQNKGLSFQLAIETLYATSKGEFLNIATKAELEAQMQQAQAMDFQRMSAEEAAKKQFETEKALLELKSNLKLVEDAQNNDAKKEMAALQSMTIANGNDINDDNENDFVASAKEEREFKREELLVKDTLERDKLALEDKWSAEEIKVLREKVKVMGEKAKAPPKKKK